MIRGEVIQIFLTEEESCIEVIEFYQSATYYTLKREKYDKYNQSASFLLQIKKMKCN